MDSPSGVPASRVSRHLSTGGRACGDASRSYEERQYKSKEYETSSSVCHNAYYEQTIGAVLKDMPEARNIKTGNTGRSKQEYKDMHKI